MRGGCINIQGGLYVYLRGYTFITLLKVRVLDATMWTEYINEQRNTLRPCMASAGSQQGLIQAQKVVAGAIASTDSQGDRWASALAVGEHCNIGTR